MTQPPERKPWQYPAKWFREEKFWFDMFTRTTSALVAALVIFITAKLAGFFTKVEWTAVIKAISASTVASVGITFAGLLVAGLAERSSRKRDEEAKQTFTRTFNELPPGEQAEFLRVIEEAKNRRTIRWPWSK